MKKINDTDILAMPLYDDIASEARLLTPVYELGDLAIGFARCYKGGLIRVVEQSEHWNIDELVSIGFKNVEDMPWNITTGYDECITNNLVIENYEWIGEHEKALKNGIYVVHTTKGFATTALTPKNLEKISKHVGGDFIFYVLVQGVIICSDSNHIKTFHEMSNSYEKDHKTTLFYDSQKKEVSVFN